MKTTLLFLICMISSGLYAQNYQSYFTGSSTDIVTNPAGGVCLMGGATENDEAMKWFLQRANGGDVLVLRASGSDGYNDYFYNQLGITLNSVETIVFNNALASNEPLIHQKINQAEAIWFAGGDQWDYISYWRGTAIDTLIRSAIQNRNIVIGGTSAGMAIQGQYYFSAENGTITSTVALNDPYDFNLTVDSTTFLGLNYMQGLITDTHYDNPDRRGRHISFMARILTDWSLIPKGIACEEYTAVCIDENGIASVYGDYPNYDDYAYFIQTNCELSNPNPEDCVNGNPLTWNHSGNALKVCKIPGTMNGNNSFDLNDWKTNSGGSWLHWSVNSGVLQETTGSSPNCNLGVNENIFQVNVFPNPTTDQVNILSSSRIDALEIIDNQGKIVLQSEKTSISLGDLEPGFYTIVVHSENLLETRKIVKK